jgi:hypothetical protein
MCSRSQQNLCGPEKLLCQSPWGGIADQDLCDFLLCRKSSKTTERTATTSYSIVQSELSVGKIVGWSRQCFLGSCSLTGFAELLRERGLYTKLDVRTRGLCPALCIVLTLSLLIVLRCLSTVRDCRILTYLPASCGLAPSVPPPSLP